VRYKHTRRAYSECSCEDKYEPRAGFELVEREQGAGVWGRGYATFLTGGLRAVLTTRAHVIRIQVSSYIVPELRFIFILVSVLPHPVTIYTLLVHPGH